MRNVPYEQSNLDFSLLVFHFSLVHQPVSRTSKRLHNPLHLQIKKNHAGTRVRDVGIDGNLIDVLVIHILERVHQHTFLISKVGEKFLFWMQSRI